MLLFIKKSGEQTGPFSEKQIQSMLSADKIVLTDLAWHDGLSSWLPLHEVLNIALPVTQAVQSPPVSPSGAPASTTNGSALFLYIPTERLVGMSIVSLGLYQAYWIYRNWRYLKERDGLTIQPFWRGIFGLLFIHSLLKQIKSDTITNRIQPASFSPDGLATGWVILMLLGTLLGRAPEPSVILIGIIISSSSVCFLLPVQTYINAVNEASRVRPSHYGWSGGHVLCLVIGIVMWLLILGVGTS